jgi:hypothetical protein
MIGAPPLRDHQDHAAQREPLALGFNSRRRDKGRHHVSRYCACQEEKMNTKQLLVFGASMPLFAFLHNLDPTKTSSLIASGRPST